MKKVLLSFLLLLVIGEFSCWLFFRRNLSTLVFTTPDLYYTYDLSGRRHNIPNKSGREGRWDGKEKITISINSWGLRGPQVQTNKTPGTLRLYFLGDSITMAGRVDENDLFINLAGNEWGRALNRPVEVINAGVGDVGLTEEEALWEETGPALKPDVVILNWYLNDNRPPMGFREETIYSDPLLKAFGSTRLIQKSYLAGYLYQHYRIFLMKQEWNKNPTQNHRFDWYNVYQRGKWKTDDGAFKEMVELAKYDFGDAWNEESLRSMAKRIAALRDSAARNGARFGVVLFPMWQQVLSNTDSSTLEFPQRNLKALLEQQDIPTLDILPSLKQFRNENLTYDHCHYTPLGHKRIAPLILEFLRDKFRF